MLVLSVLCDVRCYFVVKGLLYSFVFVCSIYRMLDAGLIDHIIQKWRRAGRAVCEWQLPKSTSTPITLTSATGMLYILGGGITVSTVVLLLELTKHYCSARRQQT